LRNARETVETETSSRAAISSMRNVFAGLDGMGQKCRNQQRLASGDCQ
jgi:hypothetical protein